MRIPILVSVLITAALLPVWGAAPSALYLGEAREATFDELNDNTVVPMRALADWLHARLAFDAKTLEYSIKVGERSVTVAAGNRVIRRGGPDAVDVVHFQPPFVRKDALYVPLGEVADALGAEVLWLRDGGVRVRLTHPKAAKPLEMALAAQAMPLPKAQGTFALFAGSHVVGGIDRGKWRIAKAMHPLLAAGTRCKLYTVAGPAGEAEVAPEPPAAGFGFPITLKGGPKRTEGVLALPADLPWNPQPRKPTAVAVDHAVYVDVVRDFLKARGLGGAKVVITKILKVDLGGDGVEETLVTASSADAGAGHTQKAGNYSVVLLRHNAGGVATTQVVTGVWYPRAAAAPYTERYGIVGLLDLDGDGTLEIIVRAKFQDGESTRVYRTSKGETHWLFEGDLGE